MSEQTERMHRLSASAVVGAPPARVWEVLTDYRDEHARILPRPPFGSMEVEQGGRGAGTVILLEMRAFGTTRTTRGFVTEPEPGRFLVESYPDAGIVTSFRVDPGPRDGEAEVTIASELPARGGIAGVLERWMVGRFLRGVYARELAQLDAHVREHPRRG
ncbi:MAG TPA: SRPBCC family protein [Longimicrobiaceae bacterium]|nr:SRPBCC family protein [Longimicrobiaceae bacterium]